MSLQEAIDSEHGKLKAHCAGPDSGKQFVSDPDILALSPKMLMIVAGPPQCQVCHQGVFGNGEPMKMMCHKSKTCKHYDWDVSELKPDHDYVNGQCPVCRRPLRGIQGKAECTTLHRPLQLYEPDNATPVTPEGVWGCTFVNIIDLLHAYGDCLDLASPKILEGKLFMPFFEWTPPTGEVIDDSNMVDEAPELSALALEEAKSESGLSRSSRASWRSVITQQSWKSITSWRPSGAARMDILQKVSTLMPLAETTHERPVPIGPC